MMSLKEDNELLLGQLIEVVKERDAFREKVVRLKKELDDLEWCLEEQCLNG